MFKPSGKMVEANTPVLSPKANKNKIKKGHLDVQLLQYLILVLTVSRFLLSLISTSVRVLKLSGLFVQPNFPSNFLPFIFPPRTSLE